MYRRLLVSVFRGSLVTLLLLCIGCTAQSNSSKDVERRVERQIRATYASIPDQVKITLGERKPSEFPNYDTLTVILSVGERKQQQEFLISKDNNTLVRFSKMDLTKDPYEEIMKKIDISNRPWRGNKDAKVVIVSYDDFQCPYCSLMHQELTQGILKEYGDRIKIVYKDYPLSEIHPWATHAAVDANCLAAQNNDAYWSFADYLHSNGREINGSRENPKSLPQQIAALDGAARQHGERFKVDVSRLNACMKAQDDSGIVASRREAAQLGVEATPTIFINGNMKNGAMPPDELRAAIDHALRDAGQSVLPAAPVAPAK
jgi:protein-disulfide isomerase